jgi:hypothetical protein
MEFGVQFFPDIGPEEKSGHDYFREALDLAEEAEISGSLISASSSIISIAMAATARTRCCFSLPPRNGRVVRAW